MELPHNDKHNVENVLHWELGKTYSSDRKKIFSNLVSAALGSIPWVGGFVSALSNIKNEKSQEKKTKLIEEWLVEHSKKMFSLSETLRAIVDRLNEFPDEINQRLESEEYLQIVKKSFRIWDTSDTFEKKEFVRKLLTNAGAQKLVPDDLIRLFLDWLNNYHEIHFAVIKCIYVNRGATRYKIWQELNGISVREDSMEADVFKLLIRDLSTGGVIRQERHTDVGGNFYKKAKQKSQSSSPTLKSAFDDQEAYELTELGQRFVHYTMNELVTQVKN